MNLGIYMDNGIRNTLVHHNVITGLGKYAGIGANTPHENHLFCNNTIVHDRVSVPPGGNPKDYYQDIGEGAACNCDFDQAQRYFEGVGECVHTPESACVHYTYPYWINVDSPLASSEYNPRRLKVFNIKYYLSLNEANDGQGQDDLVNPVFNVSAANGWEILGNPDFRPRPGASALIDKGQSCAGIDAEVVGAAPDIGAYEYNGANWIPGYRYVPRTPATDVATEIIGAGYQHTCGLQPSGAIDCWGNNSSGQAEDQFGPFIQMSVGVVHSCGLTPSGGAVCWGDNTYGQSEDKAGPFTQVSAGRTHSCGLRPNGAVVCWGDNSDGQAAGKTGPFVQISAGGRHTCGLLPSGAVDCWGSNSNGQTEFQAGPLPLSAPAMTTLAL